MMDADAATQRDTLADLIDLKNSREFRCSSCYAEG